MKKKTVKKKSTKFDIRIRIGPHLTFSGVRDLKGKKQHIMEISVVSDKEQDLVALQPWLVEYIRQLRTLMNKAVKKHA